MAGYVWVKRLDGWGEVAVDPHQGIREILEYYDPDYDAFEAIIYMMPNNIWLLQEDDHHPEDGRLYTSYRFLPPIEAARQFHDHKKPIPHELAEHTALVTNDAEYEAWYYSQRGWVRDAFGIYNPPPDGSGTIGTTPHPTLPSWDRESRTLMFGDRSYRLFGREARNQMAILDAFQEAGWPSGISRNVPGLSGEERQKQTVKDFNRKAFDNRFPIVLGMESAKFTWRENPSARISPNSP